MIVVADGGRLHYLILLDHSEGRNRSLVVAGPWLTKTLARHEDGSPRSVMARAIAERSRSRARHPRRNLLSRAIIAHPSAMTSVELKALDRDRIAGVDLIITARE